MASANKLPAEMDTRQESNGIFATLASMYQVISKKSKLNAAPRMNFDICLEAQFDTNQKVKDITIM